MDLLSAVLRELQFTSAGYRRMELAAPWAIAFSQAGVRGIHIVAKGRCEIIFEGGRTEALHAGDLIITPRADAHVLRSAGARTRITPSGQLIGRSGRIRFGGDGEETVIVCGAFVFRDSEHPALNGLPQLVLVPGTNGRAPRWLRGYVDVLLSEAFDEGPGSDVVLARLSAALVARALRHHAAEVEEAGWLKGLRDPAVAKALAAMHDACERPWTVESLARIAAQSRASFAARFHALVGETPMRYLFLRRMRRAIQLLTSTRSSLAQIADEVGYGSEAALSAAFKRHKGISPAEFRRAEQATRNSPS